MDAMERGDVDAVVAMLAEDATLVDAAAVDVVSRSRGARAFLTEWPLSGEWRWRRVPARANGQSAVGSYSWDAERALPPVRARRADPRRRADQRGHELHHTVRPGTRTPAPGTLAGGAGRPSEDRRLQPLRPAGRAPRPSRPRAEHSIPEGGRNARSVHAQETTDVEDSAPKFGFSDVQEARFANDDLETEHTGVGHLASRPASGRRSRTGTTDAEEVYVVLAAPAASSSTTRSWRSRTLDAIRVSPGVTRQFEGGSDGIEVLAFGARHEGDGEMIKDWWTD